MTLFAACNLLHKKKLTFSAYAVSITSILNVIRQKALYAGTSLSILLPEFALHCVKTLKHIIRYAVFPTKPFEVKWTRAQQ